VAQERLKYGPWEIRQRKASDLLRDPALARWVEGYAAACADLMQALTGDNPCSKLYDPLSVDPEGGKMHSYAFDMSDGGRHHPISDYEDISDICYALSAETVGWIKEEQ
jgi:hypothetical protein